MKMRHDIENSKSETRMTNQIQNPKPKTRHSSSFELRTSSLIRHSDFEFRISAARRGFTLIEMITVLTIIIIVLAIAIPIWDAMMNGTNLAAAQNQISAFISNARADAIYNRQTIGVFFYIDPKSQQTAMAEVQVQTLYQPKPYGGAAGPIYTSQFIPGTWTSTVGAFSWSNWQAYPTAPPWAASNGPAYSLEMVNSPDPNNPTPGSFVFYRDVVLLPKGVGVALNNSTYTYNSNGLWDSPAGAPVWPAGGGFPPLDRYLRLGCIMFNPDGTLASIPFAVPYYEAFTLNQYTAVQNGTTKPMENLLCSRIGMYANPTNGYVSDLASDVTYTPASATATPQFLPLLSSVGLTLYDKDVFVNQHAGPQTVMDNSTTPPTQKTIGDGSQFDDGSLPNANGADMNYSVMGTAINAPTVIGQAQAADKYLEESWIDQNGTAFLVSPFNGSLIKAK
jgi:prepilin-type N-terminal cleavage/methylation domain-containing protein